MKFVWILAFEIWNLIDYMEEDKNKILFGILKNIRNSLDSAIEILGGEDAASSSNIKIQDAGGGTTAKIVEGVFSGDAMIGSDGERYNVPPNYASKSKLVEGDIMKLAVTSGGKFIYKQIKPILRRRLTGELIVDSEADEYWVASDHEKWRVLKASVTYFKGISGDEAAILVPQDGPSKWAAVENIIKISN